MCRLLGILSSTDSFQRVQPTAKKHKNILRHTYIHLVIHTYIQWSRQKAQHKHVPMVSIEWILLAHPWNLTGCPELSNNWKRVVLDMNIKVKTPIHLKYLDGNMCSSFMSFRHTTVKRTKSKNSLFDWKN